MRSSLILLSIMLLLFNSGCLTKQAFQEFIAEESAVDSTLINYALPENEGKVIVSSDNDSHPASTLTNGITSSQKWDSGEGWETTFEGPFQRGGYYEYGRDAWLSGFFGGSRGNPNQQRPRPQPGVVETDPMWRGLRGTSFFSGEVQTALAVAVVEFPEEKQIGRVVVYTVDSEKYPADEYGVSDLLLQYWAESGRSWFNVDRYGKAVGQKHDSILNNKSGRIVFRFKPIKTSKIRLAIRWTNDTEMHKAGIGLHYAKGTVRLTEIEVYGFEKKTADTATQSAQEKSMTTTQSNQSNMKSSVTPKPQTEVAESESQIVEEPEPDPLTTTLEEIETEKKSMSIIDDRSSIKELIGVYEQAYKNRDLETFVSTISPNYARDGENFHQLRQKMEKLFAKHDRVDFTLNEVRVDQNGELAAVAANYSAKLEEGKNPPLELLGRLFFKLSKEKDGWKIVRIDTQKK